MVVVMVAKVVLWAKPLINMLVEGFFIDMLVGVLANVKIVVLAVVAIALEFAVALPHSVDVVVDMVLDVLIGVPPAVGVDNVLTDANVNILALVMAVLEFTMSTLSEELDC